MIHPLKQYIIAISLCIMLSCVHSETVRQGKITCISGNVKNGTGTLVLMDEDRRKCIYTGECRNNLPHGSGELVYMYPDYNGKKIADLRISGTWQNGMKNGIMIYEYPNNAFIITEAIEYDRGLREGEARYYTRDGELVMTALYEKDDLKEEIPVHGNTQQRTVFSRDYMPGVIRELDSLLYKDFHYASLYDRIYRQKLTIKELLYEIDILQKAIDSDLDRFTTHKKTGLVIYEPLVSGRLNILMRFHSQRQALLNVTMPVNIDYGMGPRPHPGMVHYEHPFIRLFLLNENGLYFVNPDKWPETKTVIRTFEKANLPVTCTRDVKVLLMPFGLVDTNGFAQDDYMVLFGPGFFPWGTSPSLTMHEFGHTIERRCFPGNRLEEYWEIRHVKPGKSNSYDHPKECFAEDFRVLFSRWSSADFRRHDPGAFGDIRDYPAKKTQVHRLIERRMRSFKPVVVTFPDLSYSKVLPPDGVLRVYVKSADSYTCEIKLVKYREPGVIQQKHELVNGDNSIHYSSFQPGGYEVVVYDKKHSPVARTSFIVSDGSGKFPPVLRGLSYR